MSVVSCRSGLASLFALAVAALCLGSQGSHAQSVPDWTTGWQTSFGGGLTADRGTNPYGNLLAFSGSDIAHGNFSSRYNFDNGWFVGSERGALGLGTSGLGINGFSPTGAWGNVGSISYEGPQFGYNFSSAPVTVYAGFDTLKYNTAPLVGFDSTSSNTSGYGVHAGVEIRPTSNLSLSLGVGYTQQPTDPNAALLLGVRH